MKKEELKKAIKILARKGGYATLKKYGRKHYRDMIRKRWARVALKRATNKK